MRTYVITIPDGEADNANPAPDPDDILVAVCQAVSGENIVGHCRYWHHEAHTGDTVAAHSRLGITVRKLS